MSKFTYDLPEEQNHKGTRAERAEKRDLNLCVFVVFFSCWICDILVAIAIVGEGWKCKEELFLQLLDCLF